MVEHKNKCQKDLLYCFLLAVSFLLICSKNSPLYPMNDWVDVNFLFTIGRALNNGTILYQEIFDHKGPIIFFLNAFVALISDTSYIGIWLLEIISITGFFFFSIKCVRLFTEKDRFLYVLLPVYALLVLTSDTFAHGGSTEELCLFPLTYSLYYFLKILNNKKIKQIEHFLVGACVGFVFWTKYTILGMYIGAYLTLLVYVIIKKDIKKFINMLKNFAGFLIVTACILIYFIANSALYDLWDVYFYCNIFLYNESSSLFTKIFTAISHIAGTSLVNKLLFIPMYLGFLWMIIKKKKESIFCIASYATAGIFIFFGSAYYYYSFVLATFSFLILYSGCEILDMLLKERKQIQRTLPALVTSAFLCLTLSYFLSDNTYLLQYKKEDMPQYKFAEIIQSADDNTMLNYRFLDGGFYFAAEYIPQNKYICFTNLPLEAIENEQNHIVENAEVNFVITRNDKLEDFIETPKYTLVAEETFFLEDAYYDYYLYQRID